MKQLACLFFIGFLLFMPLAKGQDTLLFVGDSILAEAEIMYKLERSAAKSMNQIKRAYPRKYIKKEIDGHLSYIDGDTLRTIFWAQDGNGTRIKNIINYPNTLEIEHQENFIIANDTPTEQEAGLIMAWRALNRDMAENPYIYYKPDETDFVSIIFKIETGYRAYLLVNLSYKLGVVPFGADYLIEFNKDGKLTKRDRIHKNFIPTSFDPDYGYDDHNVVGVLHTHLFSLSPWISASDICYVMIYKPIIKWKKLTILGEGYLSTYYAETHTVVVETYDPSTEEEESGE